MSDQFDLLRLEFERRAQFVESMASAIADRYAEELRVRLEARIQQAVVEAEAFACLASETTSAKLREGIEGRIQDGVAEAKAYAGQGLGFVASAVGGVARASVNSRSDDRALRESVEEFAKRLERLESRVDELGSASPAVELGGPR